MCVHWQGPRQACEGVGEHHCQLGQAQTFPWLRTDQGPAVSPAAQEVLRSSNRQRSHHQGRLLAQAQNQMWACRVQPQRDLGSGVEGVVGTAGAVEAVEAVEAAGAERSLARLQATTCLRAEAATVQSASSPADAWLRVRAARSQGATVDTEGQGRAAKGAVGVWLQQATLVGLQLHAGEGAWLKPGPGVQQLQGRDQGPSQGEELALAPQVLVMLVA